MRKGSFFVTPRRHHPRPEERKIREARERKGREKGERERREERGERAREREKMRRREGAREGGWADVGMGRCERRCEDEKV